MNPTTLTIGSRAGRRRPALLRAGRGGLRPRRLGRRRAQDAGGRLQDGRRRHQVPALPLRAAGRAPASRAQGLRPDRADREGVEEGPARRARLGPRPAGGGLRPALAASWRPRRAPTPTRSTPRTWRTRSSSGRWPPWASRCSSRPAACPRRRCARRSRATDGAPVGLLHGFQTFPTPVEEIRFRELAVVEGALPRAGRLPRPHRRRQRVRAGGARAGGRPGARTWWRSTSRSTAARRATTTSRSLNPEDFYRMVELLRQAERAAGDGAPPRTARPRTATTA